MTTMTERLPHLHAFIALTGRKRELEAELRQVQDKLNDLEPGLLEIFAEEGIQRASVDGWTVYLHKDVWAGPLDGDMAGLCRALRGIGMSSMVTEGVNRQTLSAWVREWQAAGHDEQLPPEINVTTGYRLRAKKS